jgi:hypothetical protein
MELTDGIASSLVTLTIFAKVLRQTPHQLFVPQPDPPERINGHLAMFWFFQHQIELMRNGRQLLVPTQPLNVQRPLVIIRPNDPTSRLKTQISA